MKGERVQKGAGVWRSGRKGKWQEGVEKGRREVGKEGEGGSAFVS